MSTWKLAVLGMVVTLAAGCAAPAPEPEPEPEPVAETAPEPPQFAVAGEHPCDPVGEVHFICDMISPEDIAVVPGAEWAIASGARTGGRMYLINVGDKTSTLLFPAPGQRSAARYGNAYPDCPGPLDLTDPDVSVWHGLYMDPGADGVHTLLVVHHGPAGVDRVLRARRPRRAAEPGLDRLRGGPGRRPAQLGSRPAGRWLRHDERGNRRMGVAGRQRVGGAAAERGHRGQRHRGIPGRRGPVHRRLGRGEADPPVARPHTGREGSHPARVPAG